MKLDYEKLNMPRLVTEIYGLDIDSVLKSLFSIKEDYSQKQKIDISFFNINTEDKQITYKVSQEGSDFIEYATIFPQLFDQNYVPSIVSVEYVPMSNKASIWNGLKVQNKILSKIVIRMRSLKMDAYLNIINYNKDYELHDQETIDAYNKLLEMLENYMDRSIEDFTNGDFTFL